MAHKFNFSASVTMVGNRWLAEVFSIDGARQEVIARTTFDDAEKAQRWARETAEAFEEAGDLAFFGDDLMPGAGTPAAR